jgi:hypothetical protein
MKFDHLLKRKNVKSKGLGERKNVKSQGHGETWKKCVTYMSKGNKILLKRTPGQGKKTY